MYLVRLLGQSKSPSPVLTCSAAICFYHSVAGLESPTKHHVVGMPREIARRSLQAGQQVKQPLLALHVRRLFAIWRLPADHTLHELMKLSAVVLCYVGFLRFLDLIIVQWHEIRFLPLHMELFLEKSKTDQYRVGLWVLIARVGGVYCHVSLIEHLLRQGKYETLDPGPLIRSTTLSRSQQLLRASQPCYSTVLSWFKEAALCLGLDPAVFGTHSGRRGGTTARPTWTSLTSCSRIEHGAWRSERAKDGYVVSSLQARLSVTADMGLQPSVSLDQLVSFERAARLGT
jgi:hypothetical protein